MLNGKYNYALIIIFTVLIMINKKITMCVTAAVCTIHILLYQSDYRTARVHYYRESHVKYYPSIKTYSNII